MNKTVVLIVALFVIGTSSTYILLKPSPEKQIRQALHQLKEGDTAAAEKSLRTLPNPVSTYPQALYLGYLEQARGRLDVSDTFFHTAFLAAGRNSLLLSEIALAKAMNAFYERKDQDFSALVDTAATCASHQPALPFFSGLKNYISTEYADALQQWNNVTLEPLGEWLSFSLDNFFPLAWRKLHMAHCLIEEGDYISGREILEDVERHFDSKNQALRPLCTLFLALSYIKEAHQIPLDRRDSYYKMARFYLDQSKMGTGRQDPFFREKQRIVFHVEEEAKGLLLTGFHTDKHRWGFELIHILNAWRATDSIERLAQATALKVLTKKGSECNLFCNKIRAEFLGTHFHLLITDKVLAALSDALKGGETDHLIDLWKLVESLAPNPKASAREIATLTSEEILETIKKDDLLLSRTRRFLAFWEKLGRSSQEREMLARELLTHAKLFWHNEMQEKKGHRLMEIALKLSGKSPFVENEITTFLTRLYEQAENSNMIRRLSLIYEAMECFDISRQELVSKSTLANHLADAAYLYEAHNYPAAKIYAQWVLKFEPKNEGARRLAGLSSFNLGEYNKAYRLLKELKHPDEDSCRALMLSQAFATQEQGRHLCQMDATDSFDENGE